VNDSQSNQAARDKLLRALARTKLLILQSRARYQAFNACGGAARSLRCMGTRKNEANPCCSCCVRAVVARGSGPPLPPKALKLL